MGRIALAFRAFWRVLVSAAAAQQVQQALAGPGPAAALPERIDEPPRRPEPARQVAPPAPATPPRSEAITLLAALQREARLVDFLQESLDGYSDAQIGAAVRDVHRDAKAVLERMFALRSLVAKEEGAELEVAAGFDPGVYRLTGNVAGTPPFRGRLVHAGWRATRCEIPVWSGSREAALVVAPAEVEL